MTGPAAGAVVLGTVALRDWLVERSPSSTTVLLDEGVAGALIADLVVAAVPGPTDVRVLSGPGTVAGVAALADELAGAGCVVAVGGGAVLDRAKLATATVADPSLLSVLEREGRGGLVVLGSAAPPRPASRPALAVVPTTVGTGSERSRNAVVQNRDGRLLVAGAVLLPDLAVLDPVATRTLPRPVLLQGCFEAFARTTGPYAGSAGTPVGDRLAEAVATRLVALGTLLAGLPDPGLPEADDVRMELARLSGLGHTAGMQAGRDPYGFKAWYLSHELSWMAGVPKARALATVLPAVWARMLGGRSGWGSAERLRSIWAAAAAGGPEFLPEDPAEGLAHLLRTWGVPRGMPSGNVDRTALAHRVFRRWGDGLPFLGALGTTDLIDVLDGCTGVSGNFSGTVGDVSNNCFEKMDDTIVSTLVNY